MNSERRAGIQFGQRFNGHDFDPPEGAYTVFETGAEVLANCLAIGVEIVLGSQEQMRPFHPAAYALMPWTELPKLMLDGPGSFGKFVKGYVRAANGNLQ